MGRFGLRGETADDYVWRLAAANHLPVSYLRRYPGRPSYGPVDPVRLAAVTGRELPAILRPARTGPRSPAGHAIIKALTPPARRQMQSQRADSWSARREIRIMSAADGVTFPEA